MQHFSIYNRCLAKHFGGILWQKLHLIYSDTFELFYTKFYWWFLLAILHQGQFLLVRPEDTHLLCKGEYNCMADLLFDCFGFDQTCKSLSNSTQAKQLSTVTGSIWIHYSLHWCWGCLLYFILSVHTKAFARVWQQKTEVLRKNAV